MKRIWILSAALVVAITGVQAQAGDQAVGAVLGAGAGAMVGHSVGGREGAVVGGVIGALTGAAIARDSERNHRYEERRTAYEPVYMEAPRYRQREVIVVREMAPRYVVAERRHHRGWHKRHHRHSHGWH